MSWMVAEDTIVVKVVGVEMAGGVGVWLSRAK
jgi:hypothetical protein